MSNYDATINMDRCSAGAAGIRYCSRIKNAHKEIEALKRELAEATDRIELLGQALAMSKKWNMEICEQLGDDLKLPEEAGE